MSIRKAASWTQPLHESSVPFAAVITRFIRPPVTAIGVAWAVASIAEVLHARKLLARWSADLADGVPPSQRDRRHAHLEGEDEFGRRGRFGRGGRFRRGRWRRSRRWRGQGPHPGAQKGDGGLASAAVAQMSEDGDASEFGIDPEAIYEDEVLFGGLDTVVQPDGLWGDSDDDGIAYAGIGTEELAV